jgi:hypothetical protein
MTSNPKSTHQALTGQEGLWNIAISQHTFPDGQDLPGVSPASASQAALYRNQYASTCVPQAFEDTQVEHHQSIRNAYSDVTLQHDIPTAVFQNPQSDNQSSASDFWSPGLELGSSGISSPSTIPSETIPCQSATKPDAKLKFVQYNPSRTRKNPAPKRGRAEKPSGKTGGHALISRPDALKTDVVRSHRFSTLITLF